MGDPCCRTSWKLITRDRELKLCRARYVQEVVNEIVLVIAWISESAVFVEDE